LSPSLLPALAPAPLRVVFFGTPDLAATILEHLIDGPDEVVGVFTRPDAAKGRGLEQVPPPTKRVALEHDIPVWQPATWKDPAALEALRSTRADLGIVAAYGRLLPQTALDTPARGCINVHASLLPRWRGADPIRRSILAGDRETGITIMQMVLEMDAGDILHQKQTPIGDEETGADLESRLATLGAEALSEALLRWRAGRLAATPQDPAAVTSAPLLHKQDGRIDWTSEAATIERATRALDPWPGATTTRGGQGLKIFRARVEEHVSGPIGEVLALDDAGPIVGTGRGGLRLIEIQAAGKRRMAAADWARGARLEAGERLGD
jgi:methionyl-tRNA formyltransferase